MDQTPTPGTPAAAETIPATIPLGDAPDLATYREGRSKGQSEIPNPKAVPAAPGAPAGDEAPDPEVEGDPDLRAAIDELEGPTDNETPAEKAARTRRHKEAARKGYLTRLQNKTARLERENQELRQRGPVPAPAGGPVPPAAAASPATPQAEISDPSDPEPIFDPVAAVEAFARKYPDHSDPYAGALADYNKAWNRWDRRQADRTAAAERERAQASQRAQQTAAHVSKHAEHARGIHRDFDTAIGSLATAVTGHQADMAIAEAIADISDSKVGGEVLYRLAAQLDATLAAIKAGPRALLRHIGAIERDVTADAAKAVAPAPQIPSAAPAPHQPVAAAASASTTFDVKKDTGSVAEWRAHRARTVGARS